MQTIMGVSAGFHDAGVSVVDNAGHILFAGHSERYSRIKNDATLNQGIMDEALSHGDPHTVGWYERPWIKKTRQMYSGEWRKVFTDQHPRTQLSPYFELMLRGPLGIDDHPLKSVRYFSHHLSHAAAGFQTSPFETAIVVVIDAIGEWDTYSAYRASYDRRGRAQYKRIYRQIYPHSLGLFYSAMTQRCGLQPMEEEYIMMGMAAYGNTSAYRDVYEMAVDADHKQTFNRNFHAGIEYEFGAEFGIETLARATQQVTERCLNTLMKQLAISNPDIDDCVFMGGVALNCVANNDIREAWNRLWIMPNPGDCGSSLGAAALVYGKRLQWIGPYLGTDILGFYPSEDIIGELQRTGICGVASGRAEFGPRALGTRSLLADPRGEDIKDRVNEIKRRQKFRPFAPMILEEHAHEYFKFPVQFDTSPYMQNTYKCKRPDLFPAIVHEDGTSRVQTVGRDGHPGVRDLLEKWYVLTDCPMLLNTSLNIRGEPMVNTRADADNFEREYGVRVCS
jgi:carbamoyltransferase